MQTMNRQQKRKPLLTIVRYCDHVPLQQFSVDENRCDFHTGSATTGAFLLIPVVFCSSSGKFHQDLADGTNTAGEAYRPFLQPSFSTGSRMGVMTMLCGTPRGNEGLTCANLWHHKKKGMCHEQKFISRQSVLQSYG